jgi:hypothetical protein
MFGGAHPQVLFPLNIVFPKRGRYIQAAQFSLNMQFNYGY